MYSQHIWYGTQEWRQLFTWIHPQSHQETAVPVVFPECFLYNELKVQLHLLHLSNSPPYRELQPNNSYHPHQTVLGALISKFLSSSLRDNRNVAEKKRSCWKAICLKKKINKSLLWFEWDAPDAGHQTKLDLLLIRLQPPPPFTTTPARVQRNSLNGWSVNCNCSSNTSRPLSSQDPQWKNTANIIFCCGSIKENWLHVDLKTVTFPKSENTPHAKWAHSEWHKYSILF